MSVWWVARWITPIIVLSGCSGGVDLGAVEAERAKAVQRYDIVQAVAANGDVVVAASHAGAVMVSGDGGKVWQRQILGPVSIIDLAVCPDGRFVGIDVKHKVWHAGKDGKDWKGVALEQPRAPLAVTCDGAGRWWVVGSGARIAVSTDQGANWAVTDLQEDVQFTTVQFVDDSHGFVLGEFGSVVATEDGGASWKRLEPIAGEFYPYAAVFLDRKQGFVSGIAGQVLNTRDGGRSWTRVENSSGAALYRLFRHDGSIWGVGSGGTVARYDGYAWQSVPYPDSVPVFLGAGASLGDRQGALLVGGPGGLIRPIATGQTNGGRS